MASEYRITSFWVFVKFDVSNTGLIGTPNIFRPVPVKCVDTFFILFFAGGNARDLAREKNQKKQQEQAKRKGISDKGSNQGLTLEQRKQR